MIMKGGIDIFIFEIQQAPPEVLLPSAKNSARKAGLALPEVILKGLVGFFKKS